MADADSKDFTFIVIGGGIAGVTCIETLSALSPDKSVLLISASPIVKACVNVKQLTRTLESFEVKELPSSELTEDRSNVTVIHQTVKRLDADKLELFTEDGHCYRYKKLCLCTGGRPKIIAADNPYVLGIRDTETILTFQSRLKGARRIVVVGNGGIATELVYNIRLCDVIWAIKDESIVNTFVDAGAAKFFLAYLNDDTRRSSKGEHRLIKRHKYSIDTEHDHYCPVVLLLKDVVVVASGRSVDSGNGNPGAALGPDWTDLLNDSSSHSSSAINPIGRRVHVEYKVEVKNILTAEEFRRLNKMQQSLSSESSSREDNWPVYVELTNGKLIGCDFVVSATGVTPNVDNFIENNKFEMFSEDGALNVDCWMQTSVDNVFAAGDVCHANWTQSKHWLQMRLWTQARQMGHYAAKCMCASLDNQLDTVQMDFCFELFAHSTRFFDNKVVLLGQFNGQRLNDDYQMLVKVIEGSQYVKVVMRDGRMLGAILIGETDLEETFENLILNELDLSRYGEDLLYQDIEDFFD